MGSREGREPLASSFGRLLAFRGSRYRHQSFKTPHCMLQHCFFRAIAELCMFHGLSCVPGPTRCRPLPNIIGHPEESQQTGAKQGPDMFLILGRATVPIIS